MEMLIIIVISLIYHKDSKTNNSKKENITISKAKIKSAKKKNPQSP